MGMELHGLDEVMSKIASALEGAPEMTADGIRDVVLDIGARAADKAPVDTGALRDSMTTAIEVNGDDITGEIRFTEKYAAAQHEHVEYAHPQGGEAKYLEKAAIEKYDQIAKKVADSFSALFGGG